MIANQRKLGHAALTNRLRGAGSRKREAGSRRRDRLKTNTATAVLRTYDGTSLRFVMTAASPTTAGLRPYDYASVTSGISGDSGVS